MWDFTNHVRAAWVLQQGWSLQANAARSAIERFNFLSLSLLATGAAFGSLGTVLELTGVREVTAAVIAASALGAAGAIQLHVHSASGPSRLTTGRSIAEELKSDIYLYLTGVAHYVRHSFEDDFVSNLQYLTYRAHSAGLSINTYDHLADEMPIPDIHDFDSYVARRAVPQMNWLRERIPHLIRMSKRAMRIQITAICAGVILAGVTPVLDSTVSAAGGAVATVLAAIAGQVGSTRYERIADIYAASAENLAEYVDAASTPGDRSWQAAVVLKVEAAIASSNRQ